MPSKPVHSTPVAPEGTVAEKVIPVPGHVFVNVGLSGLVGIATIVAVATSDQLLLQVMLAAFK
jgi:hypothetical protein